MILIAYPLGSLANAISVLPPLKGPVVGMHHHLLLQFHRKRHKCARHQWQDDQKPHHARVRYYRLIDLIFKFT